VTASRNLDGTDLGADINADNCRQGQRAEQVLTQQKIERLKSFMLGDHKPKIAAIE
jgi:hypothetical protein